MSFFKRLFGNKHPQDRITPDNENQIKKVFTEEYFSNRYTEIDLAADAVMLDGTMRMIKSYFLDSKITPKVETPVNHPENLDQMFSTAPGFYEYCKSFNMEDSIIMATVALGFSDYLINKYGFKLYSDSQPEFPLRGQTLKYDKNGVVMSLYPTEYSVKVLKNEANFSSLCNRLEAHLTSLPSKDDFLKSFGK